MEPDTLTLERIDLDPHGNERCTALLRLRCYVGAVGGEVPGLVLGSVAADRDAFLPGSWCGDYVRLSRGGEGRSPLYLIICVEGSEVGLPLFGQGDGPRVAKRAELARMGVLEFPAWEARK